VGGGGKLQLGGLIPPPPQPPIFVPMGYGTIICGMIDFT